MTYKPYCGIGSRETPEAICEEMSEIAETLAEHGFTLHSGGAPGADSAFEAGCTRVRGDKVIFLPWKGFNGNKSTLYDQSKEAFDLAAKYHPAWDKLKEPVRKLMARNVQQVLGTKLISPVRFVVCWTKDGGPTGGTGQALRIAADYKIPVFNLYFHDAVDSLAASLRND